MSHSDAKKHNETHTAHSSDASEAAQPFDEVTQPLDEETHTKMFDEILDQLMEEWVWTSDVEKRDVYLSAKKTVMERSDHAEDC